MSSNGTIDVPAAVQQSLGIDEHIVGTGTYTVNGERFTRYTIRDTDTGYTTTAYLTHDGYLIDRVDNGWFVPLRASDDHRTSSVARNLTRAVALVERDRRAVARREASQR